MAALGEASLVDDSERSNEVSLVVRIPGRFSIADKRDKNGDRRKFPCRVVSISQSSMILASSIVGQIGERVIAYFEEFGNVQGSVIRVLDGGFAMRIHGSKSDRSRLLKKLTWLKQNNDFDIPDVRAHKRVIPEDPISTLILADGTIMRCFVIDMSASGAAVSADITAEIGTVLAIGTVVGKVVRHFNEGFAIHFNQLQDHEALEQIVIHKF
jgi:hypothetical protein